MTAPSTVPVERSSRRAAAGLFFAQASVAAINLPVTIVLARGLSPEGLGTYQFVNRIAFIAIAAAHLGLPHAVAWQAQRCSSHAEQRRLILQAVAVSLAMGSVVAAAGLAAASMQTSSTERLAWCIFSFYPVANLVSANLANFFRGRLDVAGVTLVRVTQALMWLALCLTLFLTGNITVVNAAWAALIAQVAGALAGILKLYNPLFGPPGRRAQKASAPRLRETMHFAIRVYPGLALRDCYLYLDQVVIGVALPHSSLGIYYVSASLTASLGLLSGPIVNTVQPIVQRSRSDDRLRIAAKGVALTTLMIGIPAFILAALASFIVPAVYGQEYQAAAPLIRILAIASIFDAVGATCYGILLGLGLPGRSTLSVVLGVVINIVALAVLLPTHGLLGATIASAVSYASVGIFSMLAVARALNVGPVRFVVRCANELRGAPIEATRMASSLFRRITR